MFVTLKALVFLYIFVKNAVKLPTALSTVSELVAFTEKFFIPAYLLNLVAMLIGIITLSSLEESCAFAVSVSTPTTLNSLILY